MTSPYFLNFEYTLNPKYLKGTLIFQPNEFTERPIIVPIEVLEPCEQYHTYHIHGSVPIAPARKYIKYYSRRLPSDKENEIRTAVKSKFLEMKQLGVLHALADLLAQNADFIKNLDEFKRKPNYPQQTPIV